MATWADVSRVLRAVPLAVQTPGRREWKVKKKLAIWERPLRKADLDALGDAAPTGPVLGVYVPLEVKEALLRGRRGPYFTTPHFDGYPYVLVVLRRITPGALKKLLPQACAARATKVARPG